MAISRRSDSGARHIGQNFRREINDPSDKKMFLTGSKIKESQNCARLRIVTAKLILPTNSTSR
jgi:hypothetical protein